jgi:hypothetical protein
MSVVVIAAKRGLDGIRQLPTDSGRKRATMFKLAEYLPPFPNATWTLARQAGVTHAVSQVPPD